MTKLHRTWTEEETICGNTDESLSTMQPVNVQVLAAVCQNCGSTAESECEVEKKLAKLFFVERPRVQVDSNSTPDNEWIVSPKM